MHQNKTYLLFFPIYASIFIPMKLGCLMINENVIPTFQKLLILEEGLRHTPYKDSLDNWTNGIGWNMNAIPLTTAQALSLNNDHIRYFESEVSNAISYYANLDDVRKCVLIDMAFNIGTSGLLGFKNMLTYLGKGDYANAAKEMLSPLWISQVGNRAYRLSNMMETGKWPEGIV
jgi:lysozyme